MNKFSINEIDTLSQERNLEKARDETQTPPSDINPNNIPVELKNLKQFVVWRYKPRENGKPEKIPVCASTGKPASHSDPTTWASLQECIEAYERGGYHGIGFVFSANDPYCGIDLDECINTHTGPIEDWALEIIRQNYSYTEVSPSGTGVKIILKAKLPGDGVKRLLARHKVEIYDKNRFFTLTGDRVAETSSVIEHRQAEVVELYRRLKANEKAGNEQRQRNNSTKDLADEEILEKAKNAQNGEKFSDLFDGNWRKHGYSSQSEADLALCAILAFYTRDEAQIEQLFRASGLASDKKRNRDDYLSRTIKKALSGQSEQYGSHTKMSARSHESFADTSQLIDAITRLFNELGIVGKHARIWNALAGIAGGRFEEFTTSHSVIYQRYKVVKTNNSPESSAVISKSNTNAVGRDLRNFIAALIEAGVAERRGKGGCRGLLDYTPGRKTNTGQVASRFKLNFIVYALESLKWADEHKGEFVQIWQARAAGVKAIAEKIPRFEAKPKEVAVSKQNKKGSTAKKVLQALKEFCDYLVASGASPGEIGKRINEVACDALEYGVARATEVDKTRLGGSTLLSSKLMTNNQPVFNTLSHQN